MSKPSKTEKMVVPVLPLREVIVFPHMVVPLFVGREKSIHALEECVEKKKELFLVAPPALPHGGAARECPSPSD